MSKVQNIAVIGAGVIGLSCAISLLQEGFAATIFSKDLPQDTTSRTAAAWWMTFRSYPLERTQSWSKISFDEFQKLYAIPGSGVVPRRFVQVFPTEVEPPEWSITVPDSQFVPVNTLPSDYAAGFSGIVPLSDTTLYLDYLFSEFKKLGGTFEQHTITAFSKIPSTYAAIVNCCGVYGHPLVNDPDLKPYRGQVTRIEKIPGFDTIYADAVGPDSPIMFVPRINDCVIGGTYEADDWSLEPREETARLILEKASRLVPEVRRAKVLSHHVGLRPGRTTVRLEKELINGRPVIHNYGHGGSGFTLSWGCAKEAVEQVSSSL